MANTNATHEQSDIGHPGLLNPVAGAHEGITISQVAPGEAAGQQPMPLPQTAKGTKTQLEEILPEINNLALKVGGMKNLAAIIANLQ